MNKMNSQKSTFWQALIITVLIFGVGVFLGVVLENWRTSKISDLYQKSELDLLDIKLQSVNRARILIRIQKCPCGKNR